MSEPNNSIEYDSLKDKYLKEERVKSLKQNPKFVKLLQQLKKCDPEKTYNKALEWIDKIEKESVTDTERNRFYPQITLLLCAVDEMKTEAMEKTDYAR